MAPRACSNPRIMSGAGSDPGFAGVTTRKTSHEIIKNAYPLHF